METVSATFEYDDLPGRDRQFGTLPSVLALAACLESLEIDALALGRNLAATLIGSARLALLDL